MEKVIRKSVCDLGISAYLLMHGYKVIGRKGKTVYFDIKASEEGEFDKLSFEYVTSEYHHFDSCLMTLKKMADYSHGLHGKAVHDLGIAAYLLMHGHKVTGRKTKSFYFEVENQEREVDKLSFEYVTGPYHQFDSCLMILKKMGDYLPDEE